LCVAVSVAMLAGAAAAYGSRLCGADSLNKLLMKKLKAEADLHTLRMQQRSRGKDKGAKLRHQSFDHCDSIAMSINVGGGFPDRKLGGFTSAETRCVNSIFVVPNGSYEAMQPAVKELGQRPGGAADITCTDNAPTNKAEIERDLPGTTLTLDLGHGERRVINTMDPSASAAFSEICADVAAACLSINKTSVREIEEKLKKAGGIWKGGKVMTAAAKDGKAAVMKTFKENDKMEPADVDKMHEDGAFLTTFAKNIKKDWHGPVTIETELLKIAKRIEEAAEKVLTMGVSWAVRKKALVAMSVAQKPMPYGFCVVRGEAKACCTEETVHALKLLAAKACNFERPAHIERYTALAKPDSRGLPVLAALDGTNKTESTWRSLQTTLSAQTYSKEAAHSYIMAGANRISMKGETMMMGVPDYGHCDQQLMVDTNEVCARAGLEQPYQVDPLQKDTGARFAVQYFDRCISKTTDPPPTIEIPTVDKYFRSTTHVPEPGPPAPRKKRPRPEHSAQVDVDAMSGDMFANLCHKANVKCSEEEKWLARVNLKRESEKPAHKRLCVPGGACCDLNGFAERCKEKGSHVSSHTHVATCKHARATKLQKYL
jgi:hypothetical protein